LVEIWSYHYPSLTVCIQKYAVEKASENDLTTYAEVILQFSAIGKDSYSQPLKAITVLWHRLQAHTATHLPRLKFGRRKVQKTYISTPLIAYTRGLEGKTVGDDGVRPAKGDSSSTSSVSLPRLLERERHLKYLRPSFRILLQSGRSDPSVRLKPPFKTLFEVPVPLLLPAKASLSLPQTKSINCENFFSLLALISMCT